MKNNRALWVIAVLTLAVFNVLIAQKEALRASGESIYLRLAPVDPRSLIQSVYMRRHKIAF